MKICLWGGTMKTKILLVTTITLCFAAFPANGLCQAAVAYAITTANTASATIKASSALNKATQQIAGSLSQNLTRVTAQPRQTSRQPGRVPGSQPVPTKAQAIESQPGIQVAFSRSNAVAGSKEIATGIRPCASLEGSSGSKTNSACKPRTEEKYPSVVNLSFTKSE